MADDERDPPSPNDKKKKNGIIKLPSIFQKTDAVKAMMAVFDSSDGVVLNIFKYLHITAEERKTLLIMWVQIDGDRNNKMDYSEFVGYFNMCSDVWTKRTFDIMNSNLTGVVSFVEFITFCSKYLIIDLESTYEFCFRLLSRRGNVFNRKHKPILDLNDFKRLNDTAGHTAGDTALVMTAQVLETLVRSEDLVCRMGGDEFAVLLPDTDADQAANVVERIRAHAPVLCGVGLGPRPLAIGLATWCYGDAEVTLVSRADEAMYGDKRGVESLASAAGLQ